MGDKAAMDDPLGSGAPITDIVPVLYVVAALAALVAGLYWFRIGKGKAQAPNWRDFQIAALFTGIALMLTAGTWALAYFGVLRPL